MPDLIDMPTIVIINGFRFFFVALDRGEPVHIHIEKNEAYAKFWLKPIRLARSKGFRPHELSKLRVIIEKQEQIFVSKWHEFFTIK